MNHKQKEERINKMESTTTTKEEISLAYFLFDTITVDGYFHLERIFGITEGNEFTVTGNAAYTIMDLNTSQYNPVPSKATVRIEKDSLIGAKYRRIENVFN